MTRVDIVGERLLRKDTVQTRLDISRASLERLIRRGDLKVVRLGRRAIRVRESTLQDLIERCTERRGSASSP